MSMNECTLVDTGFFISDYACAILMRAWHKEEDIFSDWWKDGECIGDKLAELCDDPDFFKKAAAKELPEDFYDVSDVEEFGHSFQNGHFVWSSSFCGSVETIKEALVGTNAISKTFNDAYLCYVGLIREKNWFSGAYESVAEMVSEIKDYFGDIVQYFPPDFNWEAHICDINGTDFS